MAAAAVEATSTSSNRLHANSLPFIDLRLLSHPELLSLASSFPPSSLYNPQHDTVISPTPKIDKSVFNESAGSRKQTFSRLRLAPPRNHNNPQFSPSQYPLQDQKLQLQQQPPLDEESSQIVSLLKSLFGSSRSFPAPEEDQEEEETAIVVYEEINNEDQDNMYNNSLDNLISVPILYEDYPRLRPSSDEELRNAAIAVVSASSGHETQMSEKIGTPVSNKRKRGRPRKHENSNPLNGDIGQVVEAEEDYKRDSPEEVGVGVESNVCRDEDSRMVLGLAAKLEDPYGEELARRTEGMGTEAELLGFLQGVKGEWVSQRRKRKIVDSGAFGEFLPSGWKVMLCLMKRANTRFWLSCRRYISPNGQQFSSYKEASSYLVSVSGLHDTSLLNFDRIDGSDESANKLTTLDVEYDKNQHDHALGMGLRIAPKPAENEEQVTLLTVAADPEDCQTAKKYRCHKCMMSYDQPDDFLKHLISSHQRSQKTPKRLRLETSMAEKVVIRNGKYECQFCHKTYDERHRFYGHLGNHIKDYVKRVSASAGVPTVQNIIAPESVRISDNHLEIPEIMGMGHSVGISCSFKPDNETNSGVPYSKSKADTSVDTFGGNQGRAYYKVKSRSEVADEVPSKHNVCTGSVLSLLNDRNDRDFGEMVLLKCVDVGLNKNFREEESSENILFDAAKWDQEEIIDNNVNQAAKGLIDEQDQNKGGGSCMPAKIYKEIFGDQDEGDGLLSKEDRDLKGGNVVRHDGVGTRPSKTSLQLANIKEQYSSEGYVFPDDEKAHLSNSKNFSFHNVNAPGCDELGNCRNNGLTIGFVDDNTRPIEATVTFDTLERAYGSCSVVPSCNEQTFLFDTSISGPAKCTIRKPYQEKKFNSCLVDSSGNEQLSGFSHKVVEASDNMMEMPKHSGEGSCSDKHEFGSDIPLVDRTPNNAEMQRSFRSIFLAPSTNEHGLSLNEYDFCDSTVKKFQDGNKLNRVLTGMVQEEPWPEVMKEPENNELMIGLSSRIQSNEAVNSKYMCKSNEENELLRGVADMPSELVPSPGCFTMYDMLSNKGESELSREKFENVSCFEELRLGSVGNMYYDLKSFSNESTLLPYDAEIAQGFDSSIWLEKEALPLLPKVASRQFLSNVCVWCKNEFPYEAVESGGQTGSMAFTCAACKAKFSGEFSLL